MTIETISSSDPQIAGPIDFGSANPDSDPDARGFSSPPVGWNIMEIADFDIAPNQTVKFEGQSYLYHKIIPHLRIPLGTPGGGSTCRDYIPMPVGGQTVSTQIENRWLNFIGAFGFKAPKGARCPVGFHIRQLIGAKASVNCVHQNDENGVKKCDERTGEPYVNPKYFGYRPLSEHVVAGVAAATEKVKKENKKAADIVL